MSAANGARVPVGTALRFVCDEQVQGWQPLRIRESTIDDAKSVENVHLQAFDESEARIVAGLAVNLLEESSAVKIISLVAVENNKIVAHIAFSPVFMESTDEHIGYILAPLAVSPEFQKRNIGSSLIDNGLDAISTAGSFIVFVYGDPRFYSRFGFNTEMADGFVPPYSLQFPGGWQALKLNSGILPHGGRIKCVDSLKDPALW